MTTQQHNVIVKTDTNAVRNWLAKRAIRSARMKWMIELRRELCEAAAQRGPVGPIVIARCTKTFAKGTVVRDRDDALWIVLRQENHSVYCSRAGNSVDMICIAEHLEAI